MSLKTAMAYWGATPLRQTGSNKKCAPLRPVRLFAVGEAQIVYVFYLFRMTPHKSD